MDKWIEALGDAADDALIIDQQQKVKDPWCFEVTDVSKDGSAYNPAANVVTTECEAY